MIAAVIRDPSLLPRIKFHFNVIKSQTLWESSNWKTALHSDLLNGEEENGGCKEKTL